MLPDNLNFINNTITARMPRAKPKENAQKEEVQKHKALGPIRGATELQNQSWQRQGQKPFRLVAQGGVPNQEGDRARSYDHEREGCAGGRLQALEE